MRLLLALALVPVLVAAVPAGPDPVPRDAYGALFEAAGQRPLVAFLELHGSTEQHTFLRSLVRRPEFGRAYDDIVVEFGSARYQVTIDRYVRGERVPRTSLSLVWRRTTQDSGVWNAPEYEQFFRAVRQANQRKPPAERVRVLLGDPPIDWRRIRTRRCPRSRTPACLDYWIERRGIHYAGVVLRKVLGRGRKALLVAGAFHLVRQPAGEAFQNETSLIERRRPGSIFVVLPHGRFEGSDADELERRLRSWPRPSLAQLRGTWLGGMPVSVEWLFSRAACGPFGPCKPTPGRLEERADALLVLGPPA